MKLSVLDTAGIADRSSPVDGLSIADEFRSAIRGEVRFSAHDRILYSTDASIYQVEPIGVVVPADLADLHAIVQFCADRQLPMLPRGGGTSLAGQCTARAIVIDISAHCRQLIEVDAARRMCHVEAGITVDEVNRQLQSRGLSIFYAPDPATAAQCAIGGCIGNNAAGSRSIRYGRTSENVAGVEVILTDGRRTWLEPGAGKHNIAARELAEKVIAIVRQHQDGIRARFPKTIRRNAGYALDLILQQLDKGATAETIDLSGLICGSEGTLAVVASARLKLHPQPKARALAIVSFSSVEKAIDAVQPILRTNPSAIELLDDVVLAAAADNRECRNYVELLPLASGGAKPTGVLYVEYEASDDPDQEFADSFKRLREVIGLAGIETYRDAAAMNQAWTLRRAGEPLLHGLPGKRKPMTFVEDNAIPVENLGRFVREFKRICADYGTTAAYWAHASVGVLHVRPLIDLHDAEDRKRMQSIAVAVADLARDCGGVMSGEHGDGKARGPLLERYFGPELMGAFRQIKQVFDPQNLLNPGNIVASGPVETIATGLRIDSLVESALDRVDPYFDYAGHGLRDSVETCNGAGVCRKTAGGVMCPSYRATLDERHSTRGRGNALRAALLGSPESTAGLPKWDDAETIATLDLCLSCKACKSECPSNVDMAKLKAEYTAQRYRTAGAPLAAKMFGHIRKLNRLASVAPGIANWFNRLGLVRGAMNRFLKLAPARSIPAFSQSLFVWAKKRPATNAARPKVVLFGDCFVAYNEAHIGVAAVEVLEKLGYSVIVANAGCCGRAMISNGLLDSARQTIDRTVANLAHLAADAEAVLFVEPSCLSAVKDEWLNLRGLNTALSLRQELAAKSMAVEEFAAMKMDQSSATINRDAAQLVFHGHCHQKAMWEQPATVKLLQRCAADVTVLPSGCCGMAGAFGYTKDHYDLSMKIGELSIFKPVRASSEDSVILAAGTSCRHQIHDGTSRTALHPIEFIRKSMK